MRFILCGSFALALATLPAVAQTSPTVRVRLLESDAPQEVSVEAMSAPVDVEVDGRLAGSTGSVTIARSGAGVTVRFGGTSLSGERARIQGEQLRLRSGGIDRQYTGDLAVRRDGAHLEIVNTTPLDPYVASVVAAELGFDVIEAAKAQAVLARTYALRRLGRHPTYDLDDHQGSQVFRGVGTITSTSRLAAERTAGEVLTFAGDLAEGTYFSSSGGHTADNETVWRGPAVPYLRGVSDPYDSISPHHTWSSRVPKSQVLGALASLVGSGATGIVVEERSRSGRVTRMRALGAARPTFSGAQFRRRVNAVAGWRTIQSTKFDLSLEGNEYVLRGQGFGHGVGMAQYGAIGQARAGRGYRDILTYYFTGAFVEGGRALPEPLLAVAEPVRSDSRAPQEPTPSRAVPRRREGTDTPASAGDPMQQPPPQSRDERAGDRRTGDRRSGLDRRTRTVVVAGDERRQSTGRRAGTDRRDSDRRQTTWQAPAEESTPSRRTAW